jgi:hypothetical protein
MVKLNFDIVDCESIRYAVTSHTKHNNRNRDIPNCYKMLFIQKVDITNGGMTGGKRTRKKTNKWERRKKWKRIEKRRERTYRVLV